MKMRYISDKKILIPAGLGNFLYFLKKLLENYST